MGPAKRAPGASAARAGVGSGHLGTARRAKHLEKRLIATYQRIQRDPVEMGEERLGRVRNSQPQPTRADQRAGIVHIRKTLSQRRGPFKVAKHIADQDITCSAPKRHTTTAPLRCEVAQLRQLIDDLRQMALGGIAARSDLALCHAPPLMDRAKHQHAHGDVAAFGDPHERVAFPGGCISTIMPAKRPYWFDADQGAKMDKAEHGWVFGYGSLVNRATHGYPDAQPARLTGWRRAWRLTDLRPAPFLTAVRAPGHAIDGLLAPVGAGEWPALDLREAGYERVEAAAMITHGLPGAPRIAVYAVPEAAHLPSAPAHAVRLSYLDAVVQGYLSEFGEAGARLFFETTDGWDTPIIDDRAAPLYPRHCVLSVQERAFVDAELARLSAQVQQAL